ncbi:ADP-ribosylation factor-like protein 2 isoform X1 [Cervus elaphus]|nr:ADP-ribosylation factor-like protein 2 isoform X1 [Cervus elaphus]
MWRSGEDCLSKGSNKCKGLRGGSQLVCPKDCRGGKCDLRERKHWKTRSDGGGISGQAGTQHTLICGQRGALGWCHQPTEPGGFSLTWHAPRGLDNAGKTTILKKFNGEDIDTISPTLGFNIKTLEHRGFKLNIWDVGGQKSLRSYWRNYFESTDGLIWVVDSADRQRMQDCQRELQNLLVEERLAGATLLIFANKQDLPGALSSNAIREALELDSIRSHHWCIQGCSAVTGENLLPGIDWLLDDISSRIFMAD